MAYDFLQAIPNVQIGLIEHSRLNPHKPGATPWTQTFSHTNWTFDYCPFEGLRVAVDEPKLKLAPFKRPTGSWHLYAPHLKYREQNDHPERNLENLWFFFNLKGRFAPISGRALTVFLDPHERMAERVRSMHSIQNSGRPGSELALHGLLLCVLADMRAAASGDGSGTPDDPFTFREIEAGAHSQSDQLLARVDHIAQRRIENLPALDDLAELLDMSVSSLAHRFREETGMTIIERFRFLRIREARKLLAQPGATVKSVARKLNFSSAFYFSRVFSEITRMSPQTYMRQIKA
jgi:AraC-like DNA-binding protein